MKLDHLLYPRQSSSCIVCPDPPKCNCATDQVCFQINRDCQTCSSFRCVAQTGGSNSQGSGGVSKGALAGGVVAALLFLSAAVALFLWYRRRQQALKANEGLEAKADIPAPADLVLNRPNPNEKPPPATELSTVRVYSNSSNTTINLDPESQTSPSANYDSTRGTFHSGRDSSHTNPFDDNNSIQTAGTEGTNVIPIALVSPGSESTISSETTPSTSTSPMRPARSPDLNLEHVNVSQQSLKPYPQSQISGISGMSSRNSYMSNASYSSDFLNEAPMIMTPTKGTVRQVLGVVKAEVVRAPGSIPSSPSAADSLRPLKPSRQTVSSPLASTSFGPSDMIKESDEGQDLPIHKNPFNDQPSPKPSPSPSTTTFGSPGVYSRGSTTSNNSGLVAPGQPWNSGGDSSRPSSMSTQAGSVVDIGSATRVNLGLNGSYSAAGSPLLPRSPYRTTIGRLVSPPSGGQPGTLEEQQQRALAHAQARAQAQGLSRRVSGSSVVSSVSTRADSILEAFPFVPPSPISDRPMRSPPVSPLSKHTFTESPASKASPPPSPAPSSAPPIPPATYRPPQTHTREPDVPQPSGNRRTLGLSTGSQLSTASSGLGSFPFQIDSGHGHESVAPPSSFKGRQRASLDTLALTSDLSSYPLGFDRDSSFGTFQKQ